MLASLLAQIFLFSFLLFIAFNYKGGKWKKFPEFSTGAKITNLIIYLIGGYLAFTIFWSIFPPSVVGF
jgi:hypothetical protein